MMVTVGDAMARPALLWVHVVTTLDFGLIITRRKGLILRVLFTYSLRKLQAARQHSQAASQIAAAIHIGGISAGRGEQDGCNGRRLDDDRFHGVSFE
jgi:hypothetical protein